MLERGARLVGGDEAVFSVWAPGSERVSLRLADGREVPLEKRPDGVREARVRGVGPGTRYAFLLEGRARPDPTSRFQPEGVHGWSEIVDPSAFSWSDRDWTGLGCEDLVLYELHVGTYTEEGTFEAILPHLRALRELGVTALELMPVAEFPGRRNWGYDGVLPYAPHGAYGGPDGLRRLVDAAHAERLGVFLDVVYNHLGPEGNYLGEFGPYFTDAYRTPWGAALNFDGPDSDEVRRYFLDNALYWMHEFHVDGLRLDAVHAIFDFGAIPFLEELASRVREEAERLGRRFLLIAESDRNDPRLVRPPRRGGYGLDAVWNDDFHHALHAALTGERDGYYADFGSVEHLAKAFRDRFVYDGVYSRYRRRRHGAPAGDVPASRFVVFAQNHDQVGNRALGERLSRLVCFERLKLAAALVLLSPYVPLLFMGEEYGETNPFLYFVSHGDPELLSAVREGRKREFAAFGWTGEIPDPGSAGTFLASKLDHSRAGQEPHATLRRLYGELLGLRRRDELWKPGRARATVGGDPARGWFWSCLEAEERGWLVLFHCSGDSCRASVELGGDWDLELSTVEERFGGTGEVPRERLRERAPEVVLPPWSASLYRRKGG
ncbi:MAG: malto-oligosyltrehalose trehalohydrolase [Candidatus Binatia bacterium]|nr:MAG: malto-oligosyltrehalose trehalohydrolase [Candidatus Binatia bacterium]